MNIFAVDVCPIKAAEMLCNIHCNSQVRESTQMLANCFSEEQLKDAPHTQKGTPRKYSHWNHPSSIWVRKSKGNFLWLLKHAIELENQRISRGMNPHFCYSFLMWCVINVDNVKVPDGQLTDFTVVINETKLCRKVPDFDKLSAVEKYRQFYRVDKPFAVWKNAKIPYWMF